MFLCLMCVSPLYFVWVLQKLIVDHPRSELGLEPGGDPSATYCGDGWFQFEREPKPNGGGENILIESSTVLNNEKDFSQFDQIDLDGQVTCSIPSSRRINLSFMIKPTRVSQNDMVKMGIAWGTIFLEHLADHLGQPSLVKPVLKPGYTFDQLCFLLINVDIEGNNLILSAKSSIIKSSQQIPVDICEIRPNSVVHASDDRKTNLLEAYYIGQSVRSHVNNESGRIALSKADIMLF
ncbi:hypothetical protein L6164_033985 [Bauhinia variegata]|uniref:Uncharacterized protein n=1 Tax=Bauhinia variegata TaxID=167791 RepID=A0ACB9KU75_BAUVA|nr:hypothetical protein L6164_033985 [Bauhinia variegata]